MISKDTLEQLESKDSPIAYLLGARMRKVKQIGDVSCPSQAGTGRYTLKPVTGANRRR